MYVRTGNPLRFNSLLGEPATSAATLNRARVSAAESFALHGELSGYQTAEDPVFDGAFESVLRVLEGPSRWQTYISRNLLIARKNLPPRPFRIVDIKQFTATMTALGRGSNIRHFPGVTDKRTGVITMQEWGTNSKSTYLGAALHEAIHLVSHPPQQRRLHSTASTHIGDGLLEGLVEYVTVDILNHQKIAPARNPKMRGHEEGRQIAAAVLGPLGVPILARLLFDGDPLPVVRQMNHTFSVTGWQEIQGLTTAIVSGSSTTSATDAIKRADELRAREERRRRLNQLSQSIRHPLAPALNMPPIVWK